MKRIYDLLFPDEGNVNVDMPVVIAGPCSAETPGQTLDTAVALASAGVRVFRAGIWKPRTRPGGFEGAGSEGLRWMRDVREATGMLVATEVGCAAHVDKALEAGMDILWIGARTTVSPFAMDEIAEALRGTDIPVLVKNPVCPQVELWIGAFERLAMRGVERVGAIHRGFKTGSDPAFRNPAHWDVTDLLRQEMPHLPVICDPSHMGGKRELIAPLTEEALARGYDGVMIETHCNPDSAWTDAAQQITPSQLAAIPRLGLASQAIRNSSARRLSTAVSGEKVSGLLKVC